MKAIELKSDLHHLVDKVNDVDILKAVKVILSREVKNKHDWADELSHELRVELDDSILEADQQNTITHEEALKQIIDRYNLSK